MGVLFEQKKVMR